jgi:hypothetical protein
LDQYPVILRLTFLLGLQFDWGTIFVYLVPHNDTDEPLAIHIVPSLRGCVFAQREAKFVESKKGGDSMIMREIRALIAPVDLGLQFVCVAIFVYLVCS